MDQLGKNSYELLIANREILLYRERSFEVLFLLIQKKNSMIAAYLS